MPNVSAVRLKLDDICKILSDNDEDNMIDLDLTGTCVSGIGARALGSALKSNTKLQSLSLGYNLISSLGATTLVEGMMNISKLDLRGNSIGNDGVISIADSLLLSSSSTLQHLIIRDNNITSLGAIKLSQVLETNDVLQSLDMGSNRIGERGNHDGATAIYNLLRRNTSIQFLSLWSNAISEEGIRLLAKSISVNTTLKHLNLGGNTIGTNGATAIAKAVRSNTKLQSLYLSNSCMTCAGAIELANALLQNRSLTTLDVMHNLNIGFDGTMVFCNVLRHCNTSQMKELRFDCFNQQRQICCNSNSGHCTTTNIENYECCEDEDYYCGSNSSSRAEINVYLRWNRDGRAESLSTNNHLPWAEILQRLDPDILYLMLLQKPELIQQEQV